jgi:hypothetical protein
MSIPYSTLNSRVVFPEAAATVPNTPVGFRVPPHCRSCGAVGSVSPETTIERGLVRLTWCCRNCGYEWPITRGEEQHMKRGSRSPGRPKAGGSSSESGAPEE